MRISDWSSDVCSSDLNWRIDHFKALFHGSGYHFARCGHVDGGAIEKQGSRRCCTENLIAVDHVHMLTSRKHCHHGISTCNSGSSRGGAAASGVHSLRERCFRKVERGDLMACLCQVRGHAAAHIAHEIGRASCRERVCQYVSISVVAVSLKK